MPHRCVKCGTVYKSSSKELMQGCTCGSRVFMFLKEEQLSLKEQVEVFERESRELMQNNEQLQELSELTPISIEKAEIQENNAVAPGAIVPGEALVSVPEKIAETRKETIKSVENVTVLGKGVYELDVASLMAGNPLVIRSEHGVYYIRIPAPVKK